MKLVFALSLMTLLSANAFAKCEKYEAQINPSKIESILIRPSTVESDRISCDVKMKNADMAINRGVLGGCYWSFDTVRVNDTTYCSELINQYGNNILRGQDTLISGYASKESAEQEIPTLEL